MPSIIFGSQSLNAFSVSLHDFPYTGPDAGADTLQILLIHPVPVAHNGCLEELQVWACVRVGFCPQTRPDRSSPASLDLTTSSSNRWSANSTSRKFCVFLTERAGAQSCWLTYSYSYGQVSYTVSTAGHAAPTSPGTRRGDFLIGTKLNWLVSSPRR